MTIILESMASRWQTVKLAIATACEDAQRHAESVQLIAVSKTVDAQGVRALAALGQKDFGENYVQEALAKIAALTEETRQWGLRWHCIGPVQSNKTLAVATHFDWVHTLDRLKTAQRLSAQRPPHLADLQVCIQVNTDGGSSKSGVSPSDVRELVSQVALLPRLRLRGLMAIPEPQSDSTAMRQVHLRLTHLMNDINRTGYQLDTLSMGMSGDWAPAIGAGATMVRVGSAIFGARSPK